MRTLGRLRGFPELTNLGCLFSLANITFELGNIVESKRLRFHVIAFLRKQGDELNAARILLGLAEANRVLRNVQEGVAQFSEASKTFQRVQNMLW